MLSIRQDRGKGTRRWNLVFRGQEIVSGLTKGEAQGLRQTLHQLPAVVNEIMASELQQVVNSIEARRGRFLKPL